MTTRRLTGYHSENAAWLSDNQRALLAAEFDSEHYQTAYPDITEAGSIRSTTTPQPDGAKGVNPSPRFSTTYYLATNPDVREAEMNPLLHYVIAGEREGRHPLPPDGISAAVRELPPRSLEEQIGEWLCPTGKPGLPSRATDFESTALEHDDAETVKQVLAWSGRAEGIDRRRTHTPTTHLSPDSYVQYSYRRPLGHSQVHPVAVV